LIVSSEAARGVGAVLASVLTPARVVAFFVDRFFSVFFFNVASFVFFVFVKGAH
jgi:hypothetical protein